MIQSKGKISQINQPVVCVFLKELVFRAGQCHLFFGLLITTIKAFNNHKTSVHLVTSALYN